MKRTFAVAIVCGASGVAIFTTALPAQDGELRELRERIASETYVVPPAAIARLVTAPRHLNVTLSEPGPDRRRILKPVSAGLPPVTAFARRWHNLAGLQIDPRGGEGGGGGGAAPKPPPTKRGAEAERWGDG
jgi:hypothetical protein